jgi:hypothetical protein
MAYHVITLLGNRFACLVLRCRRRLYSIPNRLPEDYATEFLALFRKILRRNSRYGNFQTRKSGKGDEASMFRDDVEEYSAQEPDDNEGSPTGEEIHDFQSFGLKGAADRQLQEDTESSFYFRGSPSQASFCVQGDSLDDAEPNTHFSTGSELAPDDHSQPHRCSQVAVGLPSQADASLASVFDPPFTDSSGPSQSDGIRNKSDNSGDFAGGLAPQVQYTKPWKSATRDKSDRVRKSMGRMLGQITGGALASLDNIL